MNFYVLQKKIINNNNKKKILVFNIKIQLLMLSINIL